MRHIGCSVVGMRTRILFSMAFLVACSGSSGTTIDSSVPPDASSASDAGADAPPPADWPLDLAPTTDTLAPSLLGHYDLSGALFHYDRAPNLVPAMKAAGFAEWRVGLGRWEFGTLLLPTLTDGTSCASTFPPNPPDGMMAPPGASDLDLIRARDWFTYTDGARVTADMTQDDARYSLAYVRSVLDVAAAFGAAPYLDLDHMPRALAANQTPMRTDALWSGACGVTWTNAVSNARPADPAVFGAAAAGLVKRIVEGSGGERARPVKYVEMWNEPDLAYAWSPAGGGFDSWIQTAAVTLTALAKYRAETSNADGRALKIGMGSFANADIAAKVLGAFEENAIPFDFVSFHAYDDDPLVVVKAIQTVADARKASAHHHDAELALAEWGPVLSNSKVDPKSMDLPLHHATVIALGAALGLSHAHHSIVWEFWPGAPANLALVAHDGSPKPAYWAYAMLAQVVAGGAARLAATSAPDGRLDGGMGAVLASRDASGKVRVLLVNRNAAARTASVGGVPTHVSVFDDPTNAPHDVAPAAVITVPARSIVLVEA